MLVYSNDFRDVFRFLCFYFFRSLLFVVIIIIYFMVGCA